MSQHGSRGPATPSQLGTRHKPIEKPGIQFLENMLEIMVSAGRPRNEFAPANLPDQVHLTAHIPAIQVQPVAMRIPAWNRPAKQLAQQNVRECLHNRGGSAFEQIRDTHAHPRLRQANEAIRVGKGAEFHANLGRFGSRLQVPEHPSVNFGGGFEEKSGLKT